MPARTGATSTYDENDVLWPARRAGRRTNKLVDPFYHRRQEHGGDRADDSLAATQYACLRSMLRG